VTNANFQNKAYDFIMRYIVANGPAPHYTDIARALGVSMKQGRLILHGLFKAGAPGWLYPNTDYIATFPPFSSQPTQYRISVEDKQKWFGL
jgi:hypothetical protein